MSTCDVVHLLEAHDLNGGFFEEPFDGLIAGRNGELADTPGMASTASGSAPESGPYKLLQQIGEGGFGVVYMAAQTLPRMGLRSATRPERLSCWNGTSPRLASSICGDSSGTSIRNR